MPVAMADFWLMGAALIGFVSCTLLATEYLQPRRAYQALHGLPAGGAVTREIAFGTG
ncbi:hypothetical protein GCM10007418_15000 [Halopseudomonas salina]|uniref:Uncharacterized protein n=1 Tax=Halopseudomonas salina TaxID=1323744 RepID=A0ABQ1PGA5_9GAMM|nr:hypothetical protein GCM10007418_15000 [Halopseudomonas salina]